MAKESKFVWEEGDVQMTTPEEKELHALETEIAKVNAQLEAAGVSEAEQEALAKEPLGKNNE